MISVLARTAALVEVLAAAGHAGLALREAARRAGLPPATATRLLHDLCALGWADQQGLRGSYRLGPRLTALGRRRAYHGRLVEAATPVLAALAARHQARITLAVLRRGRRLILLQHGEGEDREALSERDDLFRSASGRMLIAQLGWAQRRRLVQASGLPPAAHWPGVQSWEALCTVCAEARAQGWIENLPSGPYYGVGVPVPDDEGGVAALGVAVERVRFGAAIIQAAVRAAQVIASRLDAQPSRVDSRRPRAR